MPGRRGSHPPRSHRPADAQELILLFFADLSCSSVLRLGNSKPPVNARDPAVSQPTADPIIGVCLSQVMQEISDCPYSSRELCGTVARGSPTLSVTGVPGEHRECNPLAERPGFGY